MRKLPTRFGRPRRRSSAKFWVRDVLCKRPPQYPGCQPIVPPVLLADLTLLIRPYAKLGWVAGGNAGPAAFILADYNPASRVALTDPNPADVAAACASKCVFPSGSSVADSGLPPGVVDFIVGVGIGSFSERDGFLSEARRVASANALVIVIEPGAMKMSPTCLAAVDGFWRDMIDSKGLKQEPLGVGWAQTLPEEFTDGGLSDFDMNGLWTTEQLIEYVLMLPGAREVRAIHGSKLADRLRADLMGSVPEGSAYPVDWPLVVRIARVDEQSFATLSGCTARPGPLGF
jgi:hypothetical protein